MDASGRGDYRRQEGVVQTVTLVAPAIFVNLLPSSLQKLEVSVLKGSLHRPAMNGTRETMVCTQ